MSKMDKKLILAEKPSVARDIARVLGCGKGGGGFMESDRYVVTWALGHLVTLAEPEAYGKEYKTWSLDHLPIIPEHLKLVVIKETAKQFHTVKELLARRDVGEIVIATDAGREGELVARWIIEKSGVKKQTKRLWISSVTDKAIKEGFVKLRDGREYENLYQAAGARAEADWIVGINATRALTSKHNVQLSCGRVQTPTLAIIAMRDEEIRNFKPRDYYGITAKGPGVTFTWLAGGTDTRVFDKARCENIIDGIKNEAGKIVELNKSHKSKYAPQLYDLTELQRDANNRFGFSAKETLSLMQRLYENHKILTYPRTDSRYISADIVPTIPERLRAVCVGPYKEFAAPLLRQRITARQHFVDDKKVSDHHAIIPTEQYVDLNVLTDSERKIFDLVVKRFLAVLYPPFEYEETSVKVKIGGEVFAAKGKIVKEQGFKKLYDGKTPEDADNDGKNSDQIVDQILPEMKKGDTVKISGLTLTRGVTKPPGYFTEAELLSAMENPSKYVSDKELKKTLSETGGLGTVATRADIIEKLFATFLIEKRNKDIIITAKGKQLLKLAPDGLRSPELTGEWEQKLTKISKGQLNKKVFVDEIKSYTRKIITDIKSSDEKFVHNNLTGSKCPECGKFLLDVAGKKGKMLVCQDRECGYRRNVSMQTNARCPVCKKKMELVGQDEGRKFVCACGHRESFEKFTARRNSESGVSKNEVQKYLQKQKKDDEPEINSSIADALKGLKF